MIAFLAGIPISNEILVALSVTLSVFLIDPDKRARDQEKRARD